MLPDRYNTGNLTKAIKLNGIHKETPWLKKEPEFVISKGSHSKEFANKNFLGSFYDTIYVTANAYGARIGEGKFHELIYSGEGNNGSKPQLHTFSDKMSPEMIQNLTSNAIQEFPINE